MLIIFIILIAISHYHHLWPFSITTLTSAQSIFNYYGVHTTRVQSTNTYTSSFIHRGETSVI